jgi:hypothetical protein
MITPIKVATDGYIYKTPSSATITITTRGYISSTFSPQARKPSDAVYNKKKAVNDDEEVFLIIKAIARCL